MDNGMVWFKIGHISFKSWFSFSSIAISFGVNFFFRNFFMRFFIKIDANLNVSSNSASQDFPLE